MGVLSEGIEQIIKKARKKGLAKKIINSTPEPKVDLSGYSLFDYGQLGKHSDDIPQVQLKRASSRAANIPTNERTANLMNSKGLLSDLVDTIKRGEDFKNWYDIGPFRDAFLDANPNPDDLRRWLDYQTISSQRSPVPEQLKRGSYLYHLDKTGQMPPIGEAIKFPPGYGGLAQKSIAQKAQESFWNVGGLDVMKDPKRFSYVTNWMGNMTPVTADTHAVRLPAMLSGDPRWLALASEIKDEGAKRVIKPRAMFDEGLISMDEALQWPGIWEVAPQGSEYGWIEKLYQKAADKAGMMPAQAQAAAWVGGSKLTGLKTKPGLFLQAIEDRIKETANVFGKTPSEVIKDIANGKYPLKEIMIGTGLGAAVAGSEDADAAVSEKILKELKTVAERGAPLNEALDVFRKQIADPALPKVFDKVGDKYVMPKDYSDILSKYRVSTPDIKEVGTEPFYNSILAAKNANDHGAAVYAYPREEYGGMRKFMVDDQGGAGYALKKDDIVSVFKNPQADYKKIAPYMVLHGVEEGGRKLDAFDTALPNFYSQVGFREASRLPWHEPSAPDDWKKSAFYDFNKGEPDVVFMAQDLKKPSSVVPIHTGEYDSARKLAGSYDEAVAAQDKAVKDASILSAALLMPSGEKPDRAPDGFRGPDRPWLAALAERIPSEGLLGSPATKAVLRDFAYGNKSDPLDLFFAPLEFTDPQNWAYGVGVQPKKKIR